MKTKANPALQPTAAQRLGLRLLLEPIYGFSLFNAIAAEGRRWLS